MTRLFVPCLCLAFGFTQSVIAEFSFTTFPSPTINDTWATGYDSLILRGIATNVGSHHSCIWKINGSNGNIFSDGCHELNKTLSPIVKQGNCSYDSSTEVMISNLHFTPLNATLAIELQCQLSESQTIMVLNQNCSSDIEGAMPSKSCNFGCTAEFTCLAPTYENSTFNATCEANAQWNVSTLNSCIPATKSDNTAVIVGVVVSLSIIGLVVGGFFLYRWKFKDNGYIRGKSSS